MFGFTVTIQMTSPLFSAGHGEYFKWTMFPAASLEGGEGGEGKDTGGGSGEGGGTGGGMDDGKWGWARGGIGCLGGGGGGGGVEL